MARSYRADNLDIVADVQGRVEHALHRLESADPNDLEAVPLGRVEHLINEMRQALADPDSTVLEIPDEDPPYPARRTLEEVTNQLREVYQRLLDDPPGGYMLGQLDVLAVAMHRVLSDPEIVPEPESA